MLWWSKERLPLDMSKPHRGKVANAPPHLQPRHQPQDQTSRHFQPIAHAPLASSPQTRSPQPRNVKGNPWCDCCTAQLSDDDDETQTGLLDSGIATSFALTNTHHHPTAISTSTTSAFSAQMPTTILPSGPP